MAVILGVRRVTTPTAIPTTASRRSNYRSSRWRQPLIALNNAEGPFEKRIYAENDSNTAANVNTGRVNTRRPRITAGPPRKSGTHRFGRTPRRSRERKVPSTHYTPWETLYSPNCFDVGSAGRAGNTWATTRWKRWFGKDHVARTPYRSAGADPV
jgi:hypothetical protein